MSCTPLQKAAKPVWAKQLTRLPCLVVYAKFQFVYNKLRWSPHTPPSPLDLIVGLGYKAYFTVCLSQIATFNT